MNDILVIEQDDFDYASFFVNLYIILLIIIVYIWFLDTLVDNCIGLDQKYIDFTNHPTIPIAGNFELKKFSDYLKAKKEYEYNKIKYMIIIGILSIIGGMLLTKSENYCSIGTAIAIAGGYLVLWFTSQNQFMMNRNFEILGLGITLITIVCISINIF